MIRKSLLTKLATIGIGLVVTAAIAGGVAGSYFALKSANPYKAYYKQPSGDSVSDLVSSFYAAVHNGARLLSLPGFTHKNPMEAAVFDKDQRFIHTGFLLMDDALSPEKQAFAHQIATIEYRVDQGSYITGIALGVFLNENQETFLKNNRLTWSTYGGLPFSSVTSYMGGLQKGIDYFNKFVVPAYNEKNTAATQWKVLEQVFPKNSPEYVGGFGPDQGTEFMEDILNQDVSAIMPVAGPQTVTLVNKIHAWKRKTVVIGVDSAFEETADGKRLVPGTNIPICPMSSLKDLAKSSDMVIQDINTGSSFSDANNDDYGGFGYRSLGTLSNKGVGVSKAGYKYVVKAMNLIAGTDNQQPGVKTTAEVTDAEYQAALNKVLQTTEYKESLLKKNMFYKGKDYSTDPSKGDYSSIPEKSSAYDKTTYADVKDKIPFMSESTYTNIITKTPESFTGLVKDGNENDSEKIKIILSTATSVLLDNSFSQSAYMGLLYFYKRYGIVIPMPNNI